MALTGIAAVLGGIIRHDTDRKMDSQVLYKALELILGDGAIKLKVSGSAVSNGCDCRRPPNCDKPIERRETWAMRQNSL